MINLKFIHKNTTKILILIVLILCTKLSPVMADDDSAIQGNVVQIQADKSTSSKSNNPVRYGDITILITTGKHKGEKVVVKNIVNETTKGQGVVHLGNKVLLNVDEDKNGKIKSAYIYEIIRYSSLMWISIFLFALLIIIGGIKGIKSILTLLLTGFAVVKVLIPLILAGFDPITVSILICIVVGVFNMLILNGKNKKTLAAIIGICGGLIAAGLLALFVTYQINLKGLGEEEIQMVIYMTKNPNFNFSGLLLSGILLGALGAVMDVSISIASSMHEFFAINPEMSTRELIKSGMNVGRDIMGSMANTLILAYAGSSMYTLLLTLSYGMPLTQIINQDVVASELLKALAGSVGIVLTIPLTALASGLLLKQTYKIFFR